MQTLLTILIMTILTVCNCSFRHQNNIAISSFDINSKKEKIQIAGYWVNQSYLNSLKEKKSPKIAQKNSLLVIIPESTNEKTTIMYDFHDDFNYYTTIESNNKFEIWETQDNKLTKLEYTIQVISPNKILIGETELIKINPLYAKDFVHFGGLKEEILIQEELLFKGSYLTTDGQKVEFKNNGQLSGLNGFQFFKPINDYFDEGMQVDQVILVKSKKNIDWKDLEYYGFKFNGDTLKLYKLNCVTFDSTSQNCAVVEYGKLEYKLCKINNNR